MRVSILTGESAGQILDLPPDFATRLVILGQVIPVPSEGSIQVASIAPPEDAAIHHKTSHSSRLT